MIKKSLFVGQRYVTGSEFIPICFRVLVMDKIGLSFTGQLPYDEMVANVRAARDLGFHSVWIAEHYFYRDSFASIAALASSFEGLTFGTGIVSPYTRHLGLIAMGAQTLAEITHGRFILGIGTNSRFWKVLGINDTHPLRTIRESVQALRDITSGNESHVRSFESSSLGNVRLSFEPKFNVPIYIGAIGEKMLELSALIADGVILSAGSSPDYAKDSITLLKGVAGRRLESQKPLELACYIIVLSDDEPKTRAKAKERLAGLLSLPGREKMLGRKFSKDERIPLIREALSTRGASEAAKLVGDDMLDEVSVSTSSNRCGEKLDQYREVGITLPILSPIGGSDYGRLLKASVE